MNVGDRVRIRPGTTAALRSAPTVGGRGRVCMYNDAWGGAIDNKVGVVTYVSQYLVVVDIGRPVPVGLKARFIELV